MHLCCPLCSNYLSSFYSKVMSCACSRARYNSYTSILFTIDDNHNIDSYDVPFEYDNQVFWMMSNKPNSKTKILKLDQRRIRREIIITIDEWFPYSPDYSSLAIKLLQLKVFT